MSFRELFYGSCGGLIGQSMCHPFDTVKTRLQKNPNYSIVKDFRKNGLITFYRGLASPLISVITEKSLLFSSYDLIKNSSMGSNNFFSGIAAGILTTLTVTPCERVKVRSQITNQSTYITLMEIICKDGPRSLYRGWTATLFREVPGYGLYFSTYEWVKRQKQGQPLTPIQAFLTGGLCGLVAWTFIYPSDPLKTIMQNDNISAQRAFKTIWSKSGIKGFYRGFSWGLTRAFILHGGVFLGYETVKKMNNSN